MHDAAVIDTLSKKGFAEALGVTPGRVSQMVTAGLPVEPDGRIAIDKGRAWVAANVNVPNSRRRTPIGDSSDARTSRATKDAADAEISRLKAGQLGGNLIDRQATLRAIEGRARFERDAWIGWVNRAAPEIAAATGTDLASVVAALDRLVREQLGMLAGTPLAGLEP